MQIVRRYLPRTGVRSIFLETELNDLLLGDDASHLHLDYQQYLQLRLDVEFCLWGTYPRQLRVLILLDDRSGLFLLLQDELDIEVLFSWKYWSIWDFLLLKLVIPAQRVAEEIL